MATLNFIKGSIKGKFGQFVGSSWRGTDYIKTYTPPSNPKTEGQIAVRTIFQHVIHIAQAINESVLKPYTFPKPQKLTACNRMVQVNKAMFDDKEWDQTKLTIFDGPLFNPGIGTAHIQDDGDDGIFVMITFYPDGGAASDIPIGIVHDEVSEMTFTATENSRTAATVGVQLFLPQGQTDLTKLHAYLVFSQPPAAGTNETGHVSRTAYLKVTAS